MTQSTSTLEQPAQSSTPPTLLVTPTTLVCMSREKLTAFVRYLERVGIEQHLVDMDVLRSSPGDFFYLDLAQVAAISDDAATWLKERRCGIARGCRLDGYNGQHLDGYITALRMLYAGSAWESEHYSVLVAEAHEVVTRLAKGGIACLLQQQLEMFCALAPTLTRFAWPVASEKRAHDRDFPLEPGMQPLPLVWSLAGTEVVGALFDYAIDQHTRKQVLLQADTTTRGELVRGLDLGVLQSSKACKRAVAGESLTTGSMSPDGTMLALVFASKTVILGIPEGEVLRVIPSTGNPVVWSADGEMLALCLTLHYASNKAVMWNQVELWEVFSNSRRPSLTYNGHHDEAVENRFAEHLRTLSWSPDRRLIVTGGSISGMGAVAHVWNTANGALRLVYRGHADRVTTAAFAPASASEPLVASVGDDHTVQVWHALSGERVFIARTNGASFKNGWLHENHVAWSPDGRSIAFQTERDELVVACVATGHLKHVCSLNPYALLDIAWSPDGKYLATIEVNPCAEGDEVPYCLCIRLIDDQA